VQLEELRVAVSSQHPVACPTTNNPSWPEVVRKKPPSHRPSKEGNRQMGVHESTKQEWGKTDLALAPKSSIKVSLMVSLDLKLTIPAN